MKKSYLAHAALGAVALAVLAACGSSTPEATVAPTTAQPANLTSTYRYQIFFLDALSGARITDTLQVEVKGTAVDADKVVDGSGVSIKGRVLQVTDGALSLGAELSSTTSFSVIAGNRLRGWNESGMQFNLGNSQAGDTPIGIRIVKTATAADIAAVNSDPNTGVSVAAAVAPVTGGVLQATQVASVNRQVSTTEGTSVDTGVAAVSVPANTRALNAQGQPITPVGTVSLTITSYSPLNANSLAAFPGGFAANVEIPAGSPSVGSGSADPNAGVFVSGGFAQFNMTDSAGNALKRFDKPLTLTIPLPKSTRDDDGNLVQAGGTFPVWSFDETTGVWKYEAAGTIREKTPVDPANFEVAFQSTHLSSWNLDIRSNACNTSFILNRAGGAADTRRLRVVAKGVTGRPVSLNALTQRGQTGVETVTLQRSPRGSTFKVDVYDASNLRDQILVASTGTPITTCSTGTSIPVPIPPRAPATLVVNVTESCTGNDTPLRGSPASFTLAYPVRNDTGGTAAVPTGATDSTPASATVTLGGMPESTVNGVVAVKNRYIPGGAGVNTATFTATAGATTSVSVNLANLKCTTGGVPL